MSSDPRLVRRIVSPITSAVNESAEESTTVRQTPETAIESPCRTSPTTVLARIVSRAASADRTSRSTEPRSSMIPVNTRYLLACSSSLLYPQVTGPG